MSLWNKLPKMDDDAMLRTIKERGTDYARGDIAKARAELVAQWRAAHPEAAAEVSGVHRPLDLHWTKPATSKNKDLPNEIWVNDIYHVALRRVEDRVFGTREGIIQLGINTHDGTARHDWREFQAIKAQFAGPECEGFELYPAESRLLDPSNYYTLWCFPGIKRLKVGKDGERRVWNADEALAPQRMFAKENS
jgi:hypothetical protein